MGWGPPLERGRRESVTDGSLGIPRRFLSEGSRGSTPTCVTIDCDAPETWRSPSTARRDGDQAPSALWIGSCAELHKEPPTGAGGSNSRESRRNISISAESAEGARGSVGQPTPRREPPSRPHSNLRTEQIPSCTAESCPIAPKRAPEPLSRGRSRCADVHVPAFCSLELGGR